jgi:hypothetical protein
MFQLCLPKGTRRRHFCDHFARPKSRRVNISDGRWAEGRAERAGEIAAEFVRLKVDVIVTHATAPVLAAKQATSVIPIVFAVAADPLGAGLVKWPRVMMAQRYPGRKGQNNKSLV